jgi:outer membrane protein assembly factor BamB
MKLIIKTSFYFLIILLSACSKNKYSSTDGESIFNISSKLYTDPSLYGSDIKTPELLASNCNIKGDFDIKNQNTNYLYNGNFELQRITKLGLFSFKNELNFQNGVVICGHNLYYITNSGDVMAYKIDGERVIKNWSKNINKKSNEKSTFLSGNIAYSSKQNILYITTNNGKMMALNGVNGSVVWTRKFNDSFSSSITFNDNEKLGFITSNSDSVIGIDLTNGHTIWEKKSLDINVVTSNIVSPIVVYNSEHIIATLASGEVLMLKQQDGSQKWRYKIINDRVSGNIVNIGDIDFAPLVTKEIIVVGGIRSSIIGINAENGMPIWQIKSTLNSNFLHNGYNFGFFLNSDGSVVAFDVRSGKVKWIYDKLSSVFKKQVPAYTNEGNSTFVKRINRFFPLMINSDIFINDELANMYQININNGELLQIYKTTYGVSSVPIVQENAIFLLDDFNNLYIAK